MKLTNYLQSFIAYLWSLFLNGLLTILPITLTLSVFNVSFRLLKGWLEPIAQVCPKYLLCLPHAEIFLAVAIIFLIGTVLKIFVLRSLVHTVESILLKVPIISTVYSGIQQLVKALNPKDVLTFKQVVMLEFPRAGVYSIGFLTSEMPQVLAPEADKDFVNVFVPTTPMPTSGFFVVVTRDKVIPSKLTHQEAIALIISGGIIKPDRFTK
jgi:uncharacterized membrane protein